MKNLKDLGIEGYSISVDGLVWSVKSDRFLKGTLQKNGYMTVSLHRKTHYVHRLMLLAFKPEEFKPNLEVNHKNGDKLDNRLSNLEWCSSRQNSIHAVRTGLNPARKFEEDLVHKVCSYLEDGWRNKDISDVLQVDQHFIAQVRSGQIAEYISCEYQFPTRKNDKLSPEKVSRICADIEKGVESLVDIANKHCVNANAVRNIKARRIHKKISTSYDW